MIVSVLCAARNSVYKTLPGVEVYDAARDARTFPGDTPIVAHPPCRAWSAFLRHQAKPSEGEKELGLWCAEQLKKCGGVLEQPAHSHLFQAAGLPQPGTSVGELWSLRVWQVWWGHINRKDTWLCFSKVPSEAIDIPLRLHAIGGDSRRWKLHKRNRSATPQLFARWLVEAARSVV